MHSLNVVVANRDEQAASRLASSLVPHFRSVAVARSLEEVRRAIPKQRVQLAIVDLEMASMDEIAQLCREFDHTQVVCTHRIPDEEMWAEVLAAGALDCCQNADAGGIVETVRRNFRSAARSNAA
jgi:DNA-binding NtrC family response regulator